MNNDELYHYGVKGMKWGVRNAETIARYHRNRGPSAILARRSNKKVDKSFDDWKRNDALKKDAIEKGIKANQSRIAYEKDKKNSDLKRQYKADQKAYKEAYSKNTTYRKGDIKQAVLQDSARKSLSEAKRIKKQLDKDPTNKDLQKQYKTFQDHHDVDRAKARRAPEAARNRSQAIANLKRARTIAVKTAIASAAVAVGAKYCKEHNINIDLNEVAVNTKRILNIARYIG